VNSASAAGVIGPYRVLRQVREGGQGRLLLGFDDRLRRQVAIKILPLPTGRGARRDRLREARVLASMDSDRVVRIHDVLVAGDHMAMVMEYVPGCDLEELLARTSLSAASVLAVAGDVAAALACARRARVVHGDLKPANLLITDAGRVKLTDFGIAPAWRRPEAPSRRGGSRPCLAPEQLRGEALDVRTDLFALGCVLYRMLYGTYPFMGEGGLDTHALMRGDLPSPERFSVAGDEIPGRLEALVRALLAPDPARRPDDTHEVRGVLRELKREVAATVDNPLLAEAQPCFRAESAADVPLSIPPELERARSGDATQSGRRLRWLFAAGVPVLALCTLVALWSLRDRPLWIELPGIYADPGVPLPGFLSERWLAGATGDAVRRVLNVGPAQVIAPQAGRRTLDMRLVHRPENRPGERLRLALHCAADWCRLELQRRGVKTRRSAQAMVRPSMPRARWRAAIEDAVAALFRD